MRNPLLAALVASTLLSSACYVSVDGDPPGPSTGDLTLRYTFGGLYCDAAGVSRIIVSAQGLSGRDRYDDNLSCASFADGVTVENLIADRYVVTIEGRSINGDLLYALDAKTIEVSAFAHQEYDFDVPAQSGSLTVYWTFNGRGDCGAVTDVRVRLVDPEGFIYDDARYACDFGGIIYDVISAGRWDVSIDGLSASGRVLYRIDSQPIDVLSAASNEYTIDLGEVR